MKLKWSRIVKILAANNRILHPVAIMNSIRSEDCNAFRKHTPNKFTVRPLVMFKNNEDA